MIFGPPDFVPPSPGTMLSRVGKDADLCRPRSHSRSAVTGPQSHESIGIPSHL